MAERNQAIGFKSVKFLKDQALGIGSYGKVCKAKCDDLLCAAKLMHETLYDRNAQQLVAPQREHRLPMRRFEQECEFLSTIRHPNIVQYLGIYQDPDTGLPAMLMELMDHSLTHFLESSPQPIPYHIQINICHDVILGLSFLHSNGIVHRDLSSNNVLLISNVRAKVTDFGMARLCDQNPQATRLTFTMCPGTDVYMPPEAFQDKPEYTEKIDCFSFGVITLQILTQEYPKPGDRRKRIEVEHPELPKGTLIEARICEVERRQNHIDKIDPNHTLLPIAFDCLKDIYFERPSAQQLCERVAALKGGPMYSESLKEIEARSTAEQSRSDERDREIRSLRQQHGQQVQMIQSQISQLDEKEQALRQKDETIAAKQRQLRQLEEEKNQAIEEKRILERELGHVNQQLEESEQVVALFQRRVAELEQLKPATDTTLKSKEQSMESSNRASIRLTWREGEKAPYRISAGYNGAVDMRSLYIKTYNSKVYCYTVSTSTWSQLPDCPFIDCPSVVINNLLTLVGGIRSGTRTNQLFSLTGEGSGRRWTEIFPPMPTKRDATAAVYTDRALIVAGGSSKYLTILKTVEVLNIDTLQWSAAANLPQPLYLAQAAVCGDHVYILRDSVMYTCLASALIEHHTEVPVQVWRKVAAPLITRATFVSIHGRLLAIGGKDSNTKPTTAIHMYNPTNDSWEVIGHMGTPRRDCIAAVFPDNQLMVVGGETGSGITNSTELATVE